jgi:glucose-6-phosphate isomerase
LISHNIMSHFIRPEQTPAWQALTQLSQQHPLSLSQLLADPARQPAMTHQAAGLTLDISRQRVDATVMAALLRLADQAQVGAKFQSLFRGEAVNTTEHRPAMHMALRGSHVATPEWGTDISRQVAAELDRFLGFAQLAHEGRWLAHNGGPITDVVNIGIGGSDLGPRMATQALALPARPSPGRVRVHYVSNLDADALGSTLAGLDPAHTGLIVQSKTFTTQETLTIFASARRWLLDGGCPQAQIEKHLVAVTARPELARQQGFAPELTFVFWDWVGGRYSVWSAIGLPLAMAIGAQAFLQFLAGARDMDVHALTAAPAQNLPLLMALVGIWNGNFLGASTLNIAPYAYALSQFVPFVQQLEMESNGKSTHLDGSHAHIATAPVVWGGLGIDGQHAYFQLIHQGTQIVPVDFIGVRHSRSALPLAEQHQTVMLQNLHAQAQALAIGRDATQTMQALHAEGLSGVQAQALCPHRSYAGNNPSTIIAMDELNPHTLGALIALYEHKVFAQAAIWGINPFDQWGVELGKTMVRQIARQQT